MRLFLVLTIGLMVGSATAAYAGDVTPALRRTDTPPHIDGALAEAAWQTAPALTHFLQVQPVEGARPSERTEVRFLYDTTTLYLGIRAFDATPAQITATQMQRDAELLHDDHVTIVLDPYLDLRNGFLFRVNPLGAQQDALIFDGVSERFEWDGIWAAEARIDGQGWTAELAIPFATISFTPDLDAWGVNVERRIPRRYERTRWRTPDRDRPISSLQDAGRIASPHAIDQGLGLRLKPSMTARARRERPGENPTLKLEPSLDVFYHVTPEITATVTLNTDFAETEVDERQVNLTRFPLFFPEKREFFLQDAGFFSFGGIAESPLPFFSRRIGLDPAGNPIDLLGGLKLTGRTGRVNFGFLSTWVDATPTVDAKTLTVGRLSADILQGSSFGMIVTHGDPQQNRDNTLIGADFHYRNSNLGGKGKVLDLFSWGQRTISSGATGDGGAYGLSVDYPNVGVTGNATLQHIDTHYRPALGFVHQTGIRQAYGELGYWFRPPGFDAIIPQCDWAIRTTLDNEIEATTLNFEVYFENDAGDFIFPEIFFERERLFEPFEIVPDLIVPPGDYRYERYLLTLGSSADRVLSFEGWVELGRFFTGTRQDYVVDLTWRPSAKLNLGLGYEYHDIELQTGRFIVRTGRLAWNINLTRHLIVNLLAQFDNVTENLGINARLRWTLAPGRDIFLVFNQGVDLRNDAFHATRSELIAKVSWNFLF